MLEPISAIRDSSLPVAAIAGHQGSTAATTRERRQEFEKLLSSALPRFRSIALRSLRNPEDAEDAVQEAMLSALRHLGQFDGRAQMSTWLTTIVINAARMQVRRRIRCQTQPIDEAPKEAQLSCSELLQDPSPTPEQSLEQKQMRVLVNRLIAGLPPSQQAPLRLHQQDDFSIKMASQTLGKPQGTVKAQLTRGRATLKARFNKVIGARKTQISASAAKTTRKEFLPRYRQHCLKSVAHRPVAVLRQQGGC
jgi:RNA polymerase sigma-70 factor (ECF subfamily)